MSEIHFVVEDAADGRFTARSLGYSSFAVVNSEQELRGMVGDAVACDFDEAGRRR
jgi:hypothetical protein